MSEETKKTAEAPEQEAKETEAAPQEAPELSLIHISEPTRRS